MAFTIKPVKLCRPSYLTCRYYCDKSIYQRDEEGVKPRLVHGQPYPEWRKPWIQRPGEFYSKLSIFVQNNPSPYILNAMQKLPTLTWQDVKTWWAEMKEIQEIKNQEFKVERVSSLGCNVAAVHFFTYRQAAVRLKDSKDWIKGDITTLDLPDKYVNNYYVEAIDCENFHHNGIRYEGIQNLTGLNSLKWLSLKNNRHVDVWCLDRLAGQNGTSLEYLDISGCNLTSGCVIALSRMSALKYLVITDPADDIELQAALSTLEQENPNILIKAI